MPPKYSVDDSNSESADEIISIPSDTVLEQGLRDQVAAIFKSGNLEELTVKRVRFAVEKTLGLEEGYFKNTPGWKARSDQIIKDEVEEQDNAAQKKKPEAIKNPASSPPKPDTAAPAKRTKGESAPKPRKRQKTSVSDDEDEIAASSGEESEEEVKKSKKPRQKVPREATRDGSTDASDAATPAEQSAKEESESEMSVVVDEEPKPPRKRQKKSEASSQKGKKSTAAKAKDADLDPDQAEIKRLQGWLVKCGIRKMWWRELAPYETPKAKITHLKGMLEDAGMKGRYSLEKAKQIREERELKADLEQIQQGARQWGTRSADEENEVKPRRRLARGRQALAFLESEGEETD